LVGEVVLHFNNRKEKNRGTRDDLWFPFAVMWSTLAEGSP
jgi:hypothetical protein